MSESIAEGWAHGATKALERQFTLTCRKVWRRLHSARLSVNKMAFNTALQLKELK